MRLLTTLLVALFAPLAWAAPTFDTSTVTTAANTASPVVANITVAAGTNRALVMKAIWRSADTISTVTGAGCTWAAVGAQVNNGGRNQTWICPAPSTGAQSVTVTFLGGAGNEPSIILESYAGVDQATPSADYTSATGSSAAPSVTVPNVTANDFVLDAMNNSSGGTTTADAGQTATQEADRSSVSYACSRQPGTSGGVMSWTEQFSGSWGTIAFRLVGASGSSSSLLIRRRRQ